MKKYKEKLFNKCCHKCKYLKYDGNGVPCCYAYTKGNEEWCELDGFILFEERKNTKEELE